MIYLLDGKETYYLAKKKHALLQRDGLIPENIIDLDASSKTQFSMEEAIQLCSTISLFSEQRAVVLDNPYFLKANTRKSEGKTSGKRKSADNAAADLLSEYCRKPNETTDLIFYCFGYDADKRTKEFQALSEFFGHSVTHVHFGELSPFELEKTIDETLRKKGYELSAEALNTLKMRIGSSATEFYKAIDKLDLYGEKKLNANDIEHLVPSAAEVDIWKLGTAFLAGNARETMQAYRDLSEIEGMPPQAIIPLLASQIRGVYNSLQCYECGMSMEQIKRYTGRNYPDKDIRSAGRNTSRRLKKMLSELADLDQMIKSGRIADRDGLESYLLRYM